MTRRNANSWIVVRLPERDLAELVLEMAAPLLERLGPTPALDDARATVALVVRFWNASVLASKVWKYQIAIGGRRLGPMVLTEVRCAGERHDTAVLIFRPAGAKAMS